MEIDYKKAEQEFIAELEAGKYKIERNPNTADDYQQYEDRDLDAYDKYLHSAAFKALDSEASK